jgi:hypothetical protein
MFSEGFEKPLSTEVTEDRGHRESWKDKLLTQRRKARKEKKDKPAKSIWSTKYTKTTNNYKQY